MFFRILTLSLLLITLIGCNLRENESLPSGVSPFDLINDATYIDGVGLFSTSKPNVYVQVTVDKPEGFAFIDESYNFSPSSLSYYLKLIDDVGNEIISTDFFPLVAIPSDQFTYLGLKHSGTYERFYPYPNTDTISGFGAWHQHKCCYFILSDSGYYQTVSEVKPHSTVTVEIDFNQDNDINVSLYQAQFILPRDLLPRGVQRVKLEKIDSEKIAEYDLSLSELDVSFNMIQNNPEAERYPLLYLPVPPETDMTSISVKQILRNSLEVTYHYDQLLEEGDQFAIYGNCVILLINDHGRFIIDKL